MASVALLLLYPTAIPATAAELFDQKDWVKGAVVIGVSDSGLCVFKPFVKVGDTDNDPDDDKPQILGYSPGNVVIDQHGQVVYERVLEEAFIPLNQHKSVHGRLCKCPPYEE